MMEEAVKLNRINIYYGKEHIIKDFSLMVGKGESVAILGANGSGKTTLIKAMCGLIKVKDGKVEIFGKLINGNNIRQLRSIIGYVPQSISIDKRFPISVKEVIAMGCYGKVGLMRRLKLEDKKSIEEAIEMTGIKAFSNKPIGHLSGGELQKVIIARALAQKPKIMLLDEPTSHLDLNSQEVILNIIESIYIEKKITTILVTHILDHIPSSIGRVTVINEGRLVKSGNYSEILNKDKRNKMYN